MIFFILTMAIFSLFHSVYPSLNPYKHEPFIQVNNSDVAERRKLICDHHLEYDKETLQQITDPNISVVHIFNQKDREGVCCDWALKTAVPGIEEFNIPFSLAWEWGAYIVNTYFEQTINPTEKDLVVYTENKDNLSIKHYGVITDKLAVLSKWANSNRIRKHCLFDVRSDYGNAIFFFTLKNKFKTNPHLLFQELLNTIESRNPQLVDLYILQKSHHNLLLALANGDTEETIVNNKKEYSDMCQSYQNIKSLFLDQNGNITSYEILSCLIQRIPGLDIDLRTPDRQETGLMLAAKRGSLDFTKLFLTYQANVNAQDVNGDTALNQAFKNNHYTVAMLLLKNGAEIRRGSNSIKDIATITFGYKYRNETIDTIFIISIFALSFFIKTTSKLPLAASIIVTAIPLLIGYSIGIVLDAYKNRIRRL